MDLFFIVLLSVGLAMDCFAVSISCGVCQAKIPFKHRLLMAFMFGLFQAFMPLIGWLLGISFTEQIQGVDHWLAFFILLIIGGKMIVDGWKPRNEEQSKYKSYFDIKTLLVLSVATSIDALATGLIFVTEPSWIWIAIVVIGLGSFIFSLLGSFIGSFFKEKFTFKVEILGGIILIAIGSKILIEHLFFL